MNFSFYMPSKVIFGCGSLEKLHKQKLPGKRALIVTGGTSVKKYGYLKRLEEQLDKANINHVLFDKILPNPIKDHVMEGAALAKKENCDFVIGIGGGSSMDSSKSIAIMATNEGDYWDYIFGGTGKGKPIPNDPLPIVAITTTAGTGTEADPWTVITNGNEKIGFGYEKTYPYLSIVDPELMKTVPPKLTAYQGFDALFHSTEGYINKIASEMSDLFALKAIELIGKSLADAVKDGNNMEARENVAMANTLSGIVESTSSCTSEHSMEHALSAYYPKLEHGAGLIIISKEYYTVIANAHDCDEKMINMAKALGKKDANKAMDFVDALVELQKACGVDNLKLSDYGMKKEDLPAIAKNAKFAMGGLFETDPHNFTDEEVLSVLEKSYK
ncbi:iron-containing alcohol dehydrogenase [Brachyspira hyodysenteriae]|uniref:Iron-containing alcohol dehydrogenase n=2 Tax=Brachyspira hyodysenteriae TaxID=159 RepID=A0A3B6VB24_BRAHW|nr:iron-containing alcohol dehydrogenase [Brachyspira hyodysenteriae]ACN84290.1 iron-containing alcohol dehydrogenase [Brachyspira hyodysenteriae WA1]KLI17418.1 alcohol dehydrogenase [Brachyspira hyodysenteriae]KLI20186.1 alcohol dehydrogenase [Brachyspira hyodysenteriae]KLI30890.1 alcohol dehydrogenase [Brachyspira hyodysenteriae]KLI34526.1 alcohol dehydrogenase [Brachyspira hyodysenteriae]